MSDIILEISLSPICLALNIANMSINEHPRRFTMHSIILGDCKRAWRSEEGWKEWVVLLGARCELVLE